MAGSFVLLGDMPPASPVVLSVPHAGRDYPPALRAALRVSPAQLALLEDRHVDRVAQAARTGQTTLIQQRARAWIDLNRAEHERDPKVDEGAGAIGTPASAKLRSGLGLVPRRVAQAGELWRRRFAAAEVDVRIAEDYRPYHDMLAAALQAAQARFGTAVLLDLHSMPSLATTGEAAQIVIGDRFGRSSASRFVARVEAEAAAAGLAVALNAPYAGGHVIERHARPAGHIHAIQLELDRSLYLDAALDAPGPGLERMARVVRRMLTALEDEALARPALIAAE